MARVPQARRYLRRRREIAISYRRRIQSARPALAVQSADLNCQRLPGSLLLLLDLGLGVLILIALDLILDLLILLKQKPEHLVKLLAGLESDLLVGLHRLQLFLEELHALDVGQLELALVGHQVLVRAGDVVVQLVVEGLSGDLHADAQHDGRVNYLLFQGGQKDLPVAFAVLLDGVDLLVLRDHDLVKMNLVMEKVVELEAFEGLEHLVDLALELLDQVLVFDAQLAFRQQCVLLLHALELLVKDCLKRRVVVGFRFDLLRLDVDDLPQLVQRVRPR